MNHGMNQMKRPPQKQWEAKTEVQRLPGMHETWIQSVTKWKEERKMKCPESPFREYWGQDCEPIALVSECALG